MTEEELLQAKSSYRNELSEFVGDRTKDLAERVASGENIAQLWNSAESTGRVVWIAYGLRVISGEEAEKFCRQITLGCPLLSELFLENWQRGFGIIR